MARRRSILHASRCALACAVATFAWSENRAWPQSAPTDTTRDRAESAPAAAPITPPDPAANARPPLTLPPQTPYRPLPGEKLIELNLVDAELGELIQHISQLTGKRFIYGSKLKTIAVTVVSPTPVPVAEAYEAFLAILQLHGLAVVPQGEFSKIIESKDVMRSVPPLHTDDKPTASTAAVVTRLSHVEHVSAAEAAGVLSNFTSPLGNVTVHEPRGLLIITDTGAHVERLARLLDEIDVGSSRARLWVHPIRHGNARQYAEQIREIFQVDPAAPGGLTRVIADEPTNSLIIVGHDDGYASLLGFLERVDLAPAASGSVHIVPLAHAVAEELAQTLTQMLSATAPAARGASGVGSGAAPARSLQGLFEGEVRVTADKPTNSLLVMSGAHDYAQLRRMIDDLDRRRRQVFIEAVILEVSHNNNESFGLNYHAGASADLFGQGSSLLFGGLNPIDSITGASTLQALALGVRGPDLAGSDGLLTGVPAGISIPAFGVALTALAASSSSDVLSTPHILALDNTEAEIQIGENIPLQVNSSGPDLSSLAPLLGAAAAGQGLQNLGSLGGTPRQDVGTRIKITPRINGEEQVRLEIEEEISEPGAPTGNLGVVSVVQRSARTTVVVDDEQTIVIGGLVRDTKTVQQEGIPLLSQLPLLGALFRKSTSISRKTNLILILTPHVIDTQEDLRRMFARKMRERQEFLDRHFVFNTEWQPPKDYSRATGLVEDVRQAQRADEERARLDLDGQPRFREHHPAAPLDLPPRAPLPARAAPAPAKR
jgi:general secretion pathway protein D